MPAFYFMTDSFNHRSPSPPGASAAGSGILGAVAAAAGAHAFVSVAQLKGGVASATAPGNVTGPGRGGFQVWARQIVVACLWAALIALGQLVYTKFTRHWEGAGYPTLPILSLKAADGRPPTLGINLPGGTTSSPGATPASGAPKVSRDFLDMYND